MFAFRTRALAVFIFVLVSGIYAQSSDACSDVATSVWLDTPAVFGHVAVDGIAENARFPKVTITLISRTQSRSSVTLDRSGKYCFRDIDGSGGMLIIEVENVEVGRQSLPVRSGRTMKQFQQDFQISIPNDRATAKPGVISAKQTYPRNPENVKLFDEAETANKQGDKKKAVQLLKQVVSSDPQDFVAWTQLGSLLSDTGNDTAAIDAYKSAIAANHDLAIAMMYLGRIYLLQQQYDMAIETLLSATKANPTSARSFRLLGEAYIMNRKGTLGVQALNEAIRLEPLAMADGHLLMARLYDVAGAKEHASREYRLFLQKIPQHPDAKKFQKYIDEHPEKLN